MGWEAGVVGVWWGYISSEVENSDYDSQHFWYCNTIPVLVTWKGKIATASNTYLTIEAVGWVGMPGFFPWLFHWVQKSLQKLSFKKWVLVLGTQIETGLQRCWALATLIVFCSSCGFLVLWNTRCNVSKIEHSQWLLFKGLALPPLYLHLTMAVMKTIPTLVKYWEILCWKILIVFALK